jgi:vitamin B12 transporter
MCLIGIALCLLPVDIYSQQESMLILEQIEVTAKRIRLTDVGKHTETIDSQLLALSQYNSLSEVLAFQTPLYVRSQGLGTLATLGIRGASAVHTQFLWNGIPLRNPMLGLLDIALIPSFFTDEVSIHYGGHGAAFGSGAIGGLVSLSNNPISKDNQMAVHLSLGSWGAFLGELKFDYGFNKLRFSTRIFYQEAENNFRYRLDKDQPEKNQIHHHLQNLGLLQEVAWTINDKEALTARLWLQYTDRQIPPISTQTYSQSAQQDNSLRSSLQWIRNGDKVDWQIKTALLEEDIDYQDSLVLLYTNNHFRTWLTEVETSLQFSSRLHFTGGVFAEYVKATSANYRDGTGRDQYGVFASLSYLLEEWVFRYQLREEVTDERWSPLLMDFAAEWSGIRNVIWKSSLSRNYRIPTLNDLYWRPGGNADLTPEEGWTLETGIHYQGGNGKWTFNASGTGFIRSINDWIMWLPPGQGGRNFWSPINIIQVNSLGTEFRSQIALTDEKWFLKLNLGFDLVWSTFADDLPEFMIEEGDQIFYVPVQNVFAGLTIGEKKWSGYYYHHWFGNSNGINESVASGNIGSAGLTFTPDRHSANWSVYLQADNVWNVPYRLIERRPMPGRTFKFGVRLFIF